MSAATKFPVVRYTFGLVLISSIALIAMFGTIYWNHQQHNHYHERIQDYHLASLRYIGTIKEGIYFLRLHRVSVDDYPLTGPQDTNNSFDKINVINELGLLANAAAELQTLQERYREPEFALSNKRIQKSLKFLLSHEPDELMWHIAEDKAGGLLMVQLKQLERLHQIVHDDLQSTRVPASIWAELLPS